MQSLRSSLLLCLSSTSLLLGGCSDDAQETCGPGDAPTDGLTATVDPTSFAYGGLSSLPANDCPDPDDPNAPTSITIEGSEVGGGGLFTVCIVRPDLMNRELSLGTGLVAGDLELVDITGEADGCNYALLLSPTDLPTGTASVSGGCANGTNAEGFALTLDAMVPMERTCTGMPAERVVARLAGTVAVAQRPGQ